MHEWRGRLCQVLQTAWAVVVLSAAPAGAQIMRAHFIDVGQADATLLEFPCGAVLIDAGTQQDREAELVAFLEDFFDRRSDLERTLNTVFITHAHIDHTRALRDVAENFNIVNYVDNGRVESLSGGGDQRWLIRESQEGRSEVRVRQIADSEVTELPHRNGLRDEFIDSVECSDCDPMIRVLSGGLAENPGWSPGEFSNDNNHSLSIRVDFGESSFLFTGDLEEAAIETMVDYYDGFDTLDVDLYQVGHHGSHNGTTISLMQAMTPHAAVCSVGKWDFGRRPDGSARPFTTFGYGHPRLHVIEMLEDNIAGRRSRPQAVMVAEGARRFKPHRIRDRIYGTGWDGTVSVRATLDRRYRITTEN